MKDFESIIRDKFVRYLEILSLIRDSQHCCLPTTDVKLIIQHSPHVLVVCHKVACTVF